MTVRRETLTRTRYLPEADWTFLNGTSFAGVGKNFARNTGYSYTLGKLGEMLYKWIKKIVQIHGKRLNDGQKAEWLRSLVDKFPAWIPSIVQRLGLMPHQIKPVTELVKKDFLKAARQTE